MVPSILRHWFAKPKRQRQDLHVIVYTCAACPLCDHAIDLLRRYQAAYGFTMELQDVDASERLVCDYGNCVPVVVINGKVRFRGQVNEVLLQRLLEAREPDAPAREDLKASEPDAPAREG
jgi:glutaredoxin